MTFHEWMATVPIDQSHVITGQYITITAELMKEWLRKCWDEAYSQGCMDTMDELHRDI